MPDKNPAELLAAEIEELQATRVTLTSLEFAEELLRGEAMRGSIHRRDAAIHDLRSALAVTQDAIAHDLDRKGVEGFIGAVLRRIEAPGPDSADTSQARIGRLRQALETIRYDAAAGGGCNCGGDAWPEGEEWEDHQASCPYYLAGFTADALRKDEDVAPAGHAVLEMGNPTAEDLAMALLDVEERCGVMALGIFARDDVHALRIEVEILGRKLLAAGLDGWGEGDLPSQAEVLELAESGSTRLPDDEEVEYLPGALAALAELRSRHEGEPCSCLTEGMEWWKGAAWQDHSNRCPVYIAGYCGAVVEAAEGADDA